MRWLLLGAGRISAKYISRHHGWGGSFNMEVRLDVFNLFNTTNLSDPVMDLSNASFGRSTTQLATN